MKNLFNSIVIRLMIFKYCVKQFWYLSRINYKSELDNIAEEINNGTTS